MILKGKAIYNIGVSARKPPTFGSEFGNVQLTVLFKDGHVEIIDLYENSQHTHSWESMDDFCNYEFSGEKYLLEQSMKKDYKNLYLELMVGLKNKGIDETQIVDVYYMDM